MLVGLSDEVKLVSKVTSSGTGHVAQVPGEEAGEPWTVDVSH